MVFSSCALIVISYFIGSLVVDIDRTFIYKHLFIQLVIVVLLRPLLDSYDLGYLSSLYNISLLQYVYPFCIGLLALLSVKINVCDSISHLPIKNVFGIDVYKSGTVLFFWSILLYFFYIFQSMALAQNIASIKNKYHKLLAFAVALCVLLYGIWTWHDVTLGKFCVDKSNSVINYSLFEARPTSCYLQDINLNSEDYGRYLLQYVFQIERFIMSSQSLEMALSSRLSLFWQHISIAPRFYDLFKIDELTSAYIYMYPSCFQAFVTYVEKLRIMPIFFFLFGYIVFEFLLQLLMKKQVDSMNSTSSSSSSGKSKTNTNSIASVVSSTKIGNNDTSSTMNNNQSMKLTTTSETTDVSPQKQGGRSRSKSRDRKKK
jgi:hypothetical protein